MTAPQPVAVGELPEPARTSMSWMGDPNPQHWYTADQMRAYGQACATAKLAEVEADAARWRALIGCARIRPLGSAGIVKPNENGYAHLGLELWTDHHGYDKTKPEHQRGVEWLTKFADIAALATGETP